MHKALRLTEIRRDLQADRHRPVADIAADWGLWHPSHSTQSYADMFGELPSHSRGGRGLSRGPMAVPSTLVPTIAPRF